MIDEDATCFQHTCTHSYARFEPTLCVHGREQNIRRYGYRVAKTYEKLYGCNEEITSYETQNETCHNLACEKRPLSNAIVCEHLIIMGKIAHQYIFLLCDRYIRAFL
jgi:hypothetical protein